ncbi:MAG: hypothetical protein JXB19_08955 [Bacteroidales bacterium]|nr:hypothetical protein [Bacteroidales bacterium]
MHQDRIINKFSVFLLILVLSVITGSGRVMAQELLFGKHYEQLFDSLDNRIASLEKQIPRLKESRDVSYYNLQRELDLTIFVKAYEEYVMEEQLDQARSLVERRLEHARSRKDQYSVDFYNKYLDLVYTQLKQQRMYYQELLSKEKKFKKAYHAIVEEGTLEFHQKADRMIKLALKYAHENNLKETASYLQGYLLYNEAVIYDFNTPYDLAKLAAGSKNFEAVFVPLVESDSINDIKKAEELLNACRNYSKLAGTALDSAYFDQQNLVIATALSDLLSSEGRDREIEKFTDQSIEARLDTLNPSGVFKWNDYVVVIDEFIPNSSFKNVKKGEAIIHADKMLATYLMKNKLCKSISELKFGYAFIIPYESNVKNADFYYNETTGKWQYIACYASIVSEAYTKNVSRYMPPIYFENAAKSLPDD